MGVENGEPVINVAILTEGVRCEGLFKVEEGANDLPVIFQVQFFHHPSTQNLYSNLRDE